MSFYNEEFDRKVLPIWDDSTLSGRLAENSSIKSYGTNFVTENLTSKLILELKSRDEVGVAVELLNVAALEQNNEALIFAAKRVLIENDLPKPIIKIAREVLGDVDDQPAEQEFYRVRNLRAHLNQRPRNILAWVDLAREHVILGNSAQAERAMTIALGLAPGHRWVTRVASRLFIHLDLVDKSHYLLLNHPGGRIDPWIVSAEIAVSQLSGRASKNISGAKRLLESGLNPKHTAELASALGTLELSAGANKKARNYFRNSLVAPNRNVLAQAKWVEQAHDIKAGVVITTEQMEMAYEARAWESYINGEIDKAFYYAVKWYESEPYSSKPPMLATYLAALVDKYDDVISISNQGLVTSPDNATLKLNRAYAEIAKIGLVKNRQVDESNIVVWANLFKEFMRKEKSSVAHAAANMGMLCYRIGYLDNGRAWYNHAEAVCKKEGYDTYVMCAIYHAREAIIAKAPWADETHDFAKGLLAKVSGPELFSGMFYMRKLEGLKCAPDDWASILGAVKSPVAAPSVREIYAFKSKGLESTVRFYLPDLIGG